MKILLVEDEDSIREVEKVYLKRAGFLVSEVDNGRSAVEEFRKEKFNLVVLDLNLPELDGLEVCKKIREIDKQIPIIMVTARVEEIDEIIGLESGADDYLKKPFQPNVLVARVNALLRRATPNIVETNGLRIDSDKMIVYKNNEEIILTTTQFNILHTLATRPGKVYTREEILNRSYDDVIPPDILDRTVDAHIKSIRKAVEDDPKTPKIILTVIGKGYKINDGSDY